MHLRQLYAESQKMQKQTKAFPEEFSEGTEGFVVAPVLFPGIERYHEVHKAEGVNKS